MNRFLKVIAYFGLGLCLGFMLIAFAGCGSEPPIEDWINSSVDPILTDSFKDMEGVTYNVEQTGAHEVTVYFKLDGAAELAVYAEDYPSVKDTWNNLTESMCGLSTSMIENAHNYGISNISVRVDLVNDVNNDLTLVSVSDGVIEYDCVRDGNKQIKGK